jgi:hypothetical protein
MMKCAGKQEFDIILTEAVNRFSRRVVHSLQSWELLSFSNLKLHTVGTVALQQGPGKLRPVPRRRSHRRFNQRRLDPPAGRTHGSGRRGSRRHLRPARPHPRPSQGLTHGPEGTFRLDQAAHADRARRRTRPWRAIKFRAAFMPAALAAAVVALAAEIGRHNYRPWQCCRSRKAERKEVSPHSDPFKLRRHTAFG